MLTSGNQHCGATMSKKIISLIIALLFFSSAFSAEKYYNVNVLVYAQLTPAALSAERWPVVTPISVDSETLQSNSPLAEFSQDQRRIAQNPNYRVLFNGRWKLTWPTTNTVITLPIEGGAQWGNQRELMGNIRVSLDRYFDTNTVLQLTEPTDKLRDISKIPYFHEWDQPYFSFQLMQARRMRSNELNLLENPVLGVLIKVTPA